MPPKNPWKVLGTSEPFSCPYFSVRADIVTHSNGKPIPYTSIRTKLFGVAALPIDEDGFTTLVGQYRFVLDRFTWEVPGGGAQYHKPPLASAQEELVEETGYRADHWLQLVNAPVAPGTSDEHAVGFVAWGLTAGEPAPGPEERLFFRRVSFGDAVSMALSGEVGNLCSIAVLLALNTRLIRGDIPDDLARLLR